MHTEVLDYQLLFSLIFAYLSRQDLSWNVVGVSSRSLAGRKQAIVQKVQRTRTTLT